MRTFIIIWVGQFVSLLGSGLTNFAIPIWVFKQTEQATSLTTIAALFVGSMLLASPFTGVLVDRSNKKLMMIISDLAAGLTTIVIFILFASGQLEIWHLYISAVIQGAFQSFQWPAFSAAISVMLNKDQYARSATMMSLADTASRVFAPFVAAAMLGSLGSDEGLRTIFIIDIVTFSAAIGTLFFVHIPEPKRTEEQEKAESEGFMSEVTFGFKYIFKRPSLLGLQTVFMFGNFFISISFALMTPMILLRSSFSEATLASVMIIGAIGGVIGGIIISAWGGFKRNVHGVLLGWAISGIFVLVMGLGQPEPALLGIPIVWAIGSFFGSFFVPLINGSNQAIWQAKVSPDIQGKVFSIRRLIAWIVNPLALFIAGPIADYGLEPMMAAGGDFAQRASLLVGTGPGTGMSLTFIVTGVLATLVGLGGYLVPAIRNAEDILPDHSQTRAAEAEESAEVGAETTPA